MKRKKESVQFRYYDLPEDAYVFAKLGPGWIREYGKGIDYLHFHNVLEIGYCRFGTGEMVFRDQVRRYQAGDITIIPSKYPHTTNSTPGQLSHWEYLFIHEDAFLEKVFAGQAHRLHCTGMIEAINRDYLFFPEERYPQLSGTILELMECLRRRGTFYQEESEGILASLLPKIAQVQLRGAGQTEEARPDRSSAVVMQAIDYISAHYAQPLTVELLAKHCCVSESHLRRLFSTRMKTGVLEYINFVRIQQACRMLRDTDLNISDLAYRCGFPSISTFNRNFKKITGENPCAWRLRPENFTQELQNYPIHSELGW